jgi:membrane-associated phospholipid phosphatase
LLPVDRHSWNPRASLRAVLGDREPPTFVEFAALTVLCVAAIYGTYVGLDARDARLLAAGYGFFAPECSLDHLVPLMPAMVWAYVSYFPCFLAIMVVTTQDRRVMYEGTVAYVSCAAMSALCFALIPSRMAQPSLDACHTVSCAMLRWFYRVDNGFHIFPSLHVAYPTMVWLFFARYYPVLRVLFGALVLAIWASTVLLKRHYLVDIPAGIVLGVACSWLALHTGAPLAAAVARRWPSLHRVESASMPALG